MKIIEFIFISDGRLMTVQDQRMMLRSWNLKKIFFKKKISINKILSPGFLSYLFFFFSILILR